MRCRFLRNDDTPKSGLTIAQMCCPSVYISPADALCNPSLGILQHSLWPVIKDKVVNFNYTGGSKVEITSNLF